MLKEKLKAVISKITKCVLKIITYLKGFIHSPNTHRTPTTSTVKNAKVIIRSPFLNELIILTKLDNSGQRILVPRKYTSEGTKWACLPIQSLIPLPKWYQVGCPVESSDMKPEENMKDKEI